jgi:hypothetical protein
LRKIRSSTASSTASSNPINLASSLVIYIVVYTILMGVLLRFGLVSTMACVFFLNATDGITPGTDLNTWYAPTGLASLALVPGITLPAFRRSFSFPESSIQPQAIIRLQP